MKILILGAGGREYSIARAILMKIKNMNYFLCREMALQTI